MKIGMSKKHRGMSRIVIFLIFVGIFITTFSIGVETKMSQDDARLFLEEFNKLVSEMKDRNLGIEIFLHNIKIALPMFVPGLGIGWGIFSAFSTGIAFSALAQDSSEFSSFPSLAVFLSPFGMMEITAYSIGISRSFLLITRMLRKISIKRDWEKISIEVGIVVSLLLIGGIVEAYLIEMVQQI